MATTFISIPMSGRKDEEVLAELDRIKSAFPPDSAVSGWTTEEPPEGVKNPAVWYLGRSIQKMAECDDVIFAHGWNHARGCVIEKMIYDLYFNKEEK